MKTFSTLLAAAVLVACLTASAEAAPVCLQSYLIDHTSVPDAKTILFHMKGGKIWRNTLRTECPSLKFHGFIMDYGPTTEVCSNQMSIRVIETHEVCMMGAFTPYTAPAKAPVDKM